MKILSTGLRNYIEIQGQIISTDDLLLNDPIGFTQSLLKFQDEMDAMVSACFQKDREFLKARDLAFKRFMNESDKIPYYLAIFIDQELRTSTNFVQQNETVERLDAVLKLVMCLSGRDKFLRQYEKHLSSRLLNRTISSMEIEHHIL